MLQCLWLCTERCACGVHILSFPSSDTCMCARSIQMHYFCCTGLNMLNINNIYTYIYLFTMFLFTKSCTLEDKKKWKKVVNSIKVKVSAYVNKHSPQGIKWATSYVCQWSLCCHSCKHKYWSIILIFTCLAAKWPLTGIAVSTFEPLWAVFIYIGTQLHLNLNAISDFLSLFFVFQSTTFCKQKDCE